jgi:hypothetical protein
MIGALTQKNPFSSQNRWIACAKLCRIRVAAAITFCAGRCATSLASYVIPSPPSR